MKELLQPSVSCPELIGRSTHLAAVTHLLTQIETGTAAAHTLLISGEAGIGKSRIVSVVKERAIASGWGVRGSACFESYQAIPYAPLIDLASTTLIEDRPDHVRKSVPPFDLGMLVPDLTAAAGSQVSNSPPGRRDLAQEQRRLFQTLIAWFTDLAEVRPLLIVIEDLHWSDGASLAFLPILARSIVNNRILLVVTFRADDAPPPLVSALAELERLRLAAEIALARLDQEEVGVMLQACLGLPQPVSAELRDAVYTHTDGNPFFIEETLTALVSAGELYYVDGTWGRKALPELHIPLTVQEAVRRRSALLSIAAREVLTTAAVLGRHFDFAILHQTLDYDEGTLIALIKELIAAKLIVEDGADQFAFRHALGRAAIYSGLLVRERRVLHRRLAEALEHVNTYPGDLAYHFAEAGAWERALHYAEVAAAQAGRLHAPHEVIVHLTRAIEAAEHLADIRLSALLHLRGQAHETLGDFAAALADYEAALAAAQNGGKLEDEWQALLDLGYLWSSRDYARAGDYLRRMLDRARSLDDPARLARSLNRFGNWQMNLDRPVTARRMHEEALAIFERLGDNSGLAETLDLLGVSCLVGGDFAQATTYLSRAIALFTVLDDRQGLIHSTIQMALRAELDIQAVEIAPLTPRGEPLERAVQLTRDMRWRVGEALALMDLAAHLIGLGVYGRALDLLDASLAVATEIEHQECLTHITLHLGVLYLQLHCLPESIQYLRQSLAAARQTGQRVMVGTTSGFLALAYVHERSFDLAAEVLAQAHALSVEPIEPSLGQHQLRRATAELALARGEPEITLQLVDELLADVVNPNHYVIPTLWWLRGRALSELRRHEEASRILATALHAAQVLGRQPLIWRLQGALTVAAVGRRRRDEAQRFFNDARATIDELAANIVDTELRERFRAGTYAALPAPGPLTPRQALKEVFGGLTDRELEVVRLIARGYTTRQIAETLTLSERTVTTHISNILSKLGFSSRAQVARWAAEHGIAPA